MFKRITWMAIGAGGAFWAKRRVETAVERYLPEQVADRAAASARGLGQTVKAAAAEGRDAMRKTEQELRSQVDARTFVGGRPVPAANGAAATPAAGTPSRRASRAPATRPAPAGPRRRSRR